MPTQNRRAQRSPPRSAARPAAQATPVPPSRDPRQRLLSKAAGRLAQLLRESESPQAEMRQIERRLSEADLLNWSPPESASPEAFAASVLEDNPLLLEAVGSLRNEMRPEAFETPGDLLSHLLPAVNDRE